MCFDFCSIFKGNLIMDSLEETLLDSHQILCRLIEANGKKNQEKSICQYLSSVKFPSVLDFPKGLEWFNVSKPLSFTSHLKGKVVVLDFFTYCCINCMHILPDLKEIENEFSVEDGLVVIGVHSAKFDNEKDSANILSAVQRYNISHPVVNDSNMKVWRNCDVHCWPTLLLLGPNANPLVMLMGEGHREDLTLYIRCALDFYKKKNEISNHKLPMKSAFHLLPVQKGPLLFPGKIASCLDKHNKELLAVSDTGNHRILILRTDGTVLRQIGGNKIGFKDGSLSDAEFNSPQGLVFKDENVLFVADTENHAVRKIDLKAETVETVIGTGSQGNDRSGGRPGPQQIISSPWDLVLYRTPDMDMSFHPSDQDIIMKDILIVAMAGTHQIWALFLDDTVWWKFKKYNAGICACIAGSGREENRNNSYPHAAAFAQPSGLALCYKTKEIYIADSESSAIRRLSLVDGKVSPVVGGELSPSNLFAFGDKDGKLHEAKLQHPLGVAMSADDTTLYVTDSYNHKIKQINVATNTVATLCGTKAGDDVALSSLEFNEPAALCASHKGAGNLLFVADTNNHCIKTIQLNADGKPSKVHKLELKLDPQNDATAAAKLNNVKKIDRSKCETVEWAKAIEISGAQRGKIVLQIDLNLLKGLALTAGSPQSWNVDVPNVFWSAVPNFGSNVNCVDFVVSVPTSSTAEGQCCLLSVSFNFVTCADDVCIPKSFVLDLPISFKNGSPSVVEETVTVNVGPDDIVVV